MARAGEGCHDVRSPHSKYTGPVPPDGRITWWEPYGATVRASLAELRSSGMLRPALWLRAFGIAGVLVGALVVWIVRAYPGIALPWARLLLGYGVGAPALLVLSIGAQSLAPCHIDVRRRWMQFSRGQHVVRLERDRIQEVALIGRGPSAPPRLRVSYRTRRGTPRTREVAVARAVDLVALDDLIAELSDGRGR
jgi:hypothetical protein